MTVKIHVLNVKDGDAIIVELIKPKKSLVMVIDGGEPLYYTQKLKPKLVEVLQLHNKKAPDVVVCTHYDSDHIGGLIPLIEEYIADIKEVWVHKTPELIAGYLNASIASETTGSTVHDSLLHLHPKHEKIIHEKTELYIESLPQLKRLLDSIPTDKLKQVFHKQQPLTDWPEIKILGPTKAYYDSLFPPTKSFAHFVSEEFIETPETQANLSVKPLFPILANPCARLKKDSETYLTPTNKASIILAIDDLRRRYLFTGDAGIESLKKIPDYEKELKNLFFLKVPHHASNNNISRELIELMQPIYAYNSGDKHQDEEVLLCLAAKKRNKLVKSTKTQGDLFFEKQKGRSAK